MSKLARLLKAKDPLFTLTLQQLEEMTRRPGVDVELIGDIIRKAHDRARALGLEPPDYTGEELYHALLHRIQKDDEKLVRSLGGSDPADVQDLLPRIVKCVRDIKLDRTVWALKDKVSRQLLIDHPPKNIMKKLGYRSVKQMLRKENLYEVFGALRFAEPAEWLNEFNEQYKRVTFNDFEERDIEIVEYDPAKWGHIADGFIEKKLHNITHVKELGIVLVLPVTKRSMPGITTRDVLLLLHYYNEIRLYSAFFKLKSTAPNFGEILVDTLIADPPVTEVATGTYIHWRVIQRYFGKLKDEDHPEIFEPHVQPEDLHWRKAEETLYRISPHFAFWQDMDYVGVMIDGEPVTFNMLDVAFSYAADAKFADRYLYHFRESLWNEIFIRYLGQKTLEDKILRKLDNKMIAPESIAQPAGTA